MRKLVLFAIALMFCTFAAGQALTLADVKTKDAVQLGADDLKQLLPGAKVVTKTATGSTRNWENAPGGSTTRERIAWPSSGVPWCPKIGAATSSKQVTSTTRSLRSMTRLAPGS